jgi:hypothetical protein
VTGLLFVCHSSEDAGRVDAIVAALEDRGVRCWMAPRDIKPGHDYAESILGALARSSAVLLVVSAAANASRHVRREVERSCNSNLPIIPVRIDEVALAPALDYFLGSVKIVDATRGSLASHVGHVAEVVAAVTGDGASPPDVPPRPRPAEATRAVEPARPRRSARKVPAWVFVVAGALPLVLSGIAAWSLTGDGGSSSATTVAAVTTVATAATTAAPTTSADNEVPDAPTDAERLVAAATTLNAAWARGVDAGIEALVDSSYPDLGLTAGDFRTRVWPDGPLTIPVDYREETTIDARSVRSTPDWQPDGARVRGPVYEFEAVYTSYSQERSPARITRNVDAHATIVDDTVYFFHDFARRDPTG